MHKSNIQRTSEFISTGQQRVVSSFHQERGLFTMTEIERKPRLISDGLRFSGKIWPLQGDEK